ncbi:immunoglobulin I-set domain-containing protein [Aphelenchoides avenae]|nr:immunoglobulin I-set domain-containing protein [Aphelenchus avenae]
MMRLYIRTTQSAPFLLILVTFAYDSLCDSGPPKLEQQPPETVWFQANAVANEKNKFTLPCSASGGPETFEWKKDGKLLEVDGKRIIWQKPSQSGTIIFLDPSPEDEGHYQCFVANNFGTAVSNKVGVRLGVLDHFPQRPLRQVHVDEGDSLTLACEVPYGVPKPNVFWIYRDKTQNSVLETIRRKHITVDPDGKLHFSAVEKHDGRPNLIYECAATSPVLHGEYRAGDDIQLIVHSKQRSFRHSYILDIAFFVGNLGSEAHSLYLSPEQVTVRAGERMKLMCIFGGRPVPTIHWSRTDGSDMPTKRMRDLTSDESDYGKALIIENVHPEDAGTYECQSQHIRHRIRWSINGVPLHELPDNDRRLVLDNGRILRIQNLVHDFDTGVYQCNASNPLGYVFANAFVNVKAHAPRFTMPDKRVWKVIRKSTVDMSCDVEAAPDPVVRWVDANDQAITLVPGKIHLFPNHTLRVFDVSTADEGVYYCNVSNKYGINRAYNKLEVFNPTYFVQVPAPNRLVVEAFDSVELRCEATSDPRLDIDYKWSHNGKPINATPLLTNGVSILRLDNVRGRASGRIDCASVTDVDVKISGMELIVKDTPEPPMVTSIDCTSHRALVEWRRSAEHGSAISHYTVEMMTGFRPGKWVEVLTEKNVRQDSFQAIIALSPWVNYTFRVTADNSYGKSSPGIDENASCSTRPAVPHSNPNGVVGYGNAPDNLVIQWQPMDKYDWNAPELRYLIRYRMNKPDEQWHEFLVEDPLANHTIIREQPTYQEYQIQVRAVNAEGMSSLEPTTVIGYSGEDVPEEPPQNLRVESVHNYSTVQLTWDAMPPEKLRGRFKGYKLVYWFASDPFLKDHIIVGPAETSVMLTELKAISGYSAQVHALNGQYESGPSNRVTFKTPEGAPSKVHDLRIHAVGATSMLATWQPPLFPNGQLRGYFITFENSSSGEIEETYVLHRQLFYLHEQLEPDSPYRISVWAETYGGEGPAVIRTIRTWPLRDPDVPLFTVRSTTPSVLYVDWHPSNGTIWKMPGSAFYVNYSKAGSDEWIQSESINLPITRIELANLEESTDYIIVGVAKDGDRERRSSYFEVRTESRRMISHINTENLQQAAWFIAVLIALALALFIVALICCCARRHTGKYAVKRREMEFGLGHRLSGKHPGEDDDEHKKFMEYQYGSNYTKDSGYSGGMGISTIAEEPATETIVTISGASNAADTL